MKPSRKEGRASHIVGSSTPRISRDSLHNNAAVASPSHVSTVLKVSISRVAYVHIMVFSSLSFAIKCRRVFFWSYNGGGAWPSHVGEPYRGIFSYDASFCKNTAENSIVGIIPTEATPSQNIIFGFTPCALPHAHSSANSPRFRPT